MLLMLHLNKIFIFFNNEGISKNKGIITILPDSIQTLPIITNLQIKSSTFLLGIYNQGLLQSYNGNEIFI